MTTAHDLMDAQRARLTALDPELPSHYLLPQGEPVMARLSDGSGVAGLAVRASHRPGSLQSLWSASESAELFPLVGDRPREGMDALLGAWRDQLAAQGMPNADSSCLVTWPSRDVQATRALLDHGFTPLSCLAVRSTPRRTPEPFAERSGTVNIRRAGPDDLDTVVEFTLKELEYASLVGASVHRPDAATLKRTAAHVRLHGSGPDGRDPVWIAERDGVPVGLAECGWTDTAKHHSGRRLRPGRWAYVNCVSVDERERGTGVGTELMALAHQEFARAGVLGSYLYYNPPNPLSSVFWPRQGYRPLWTMWEVRPATAVR